MQTRNHFPHHNVVMKPLLLGVLLASFNVSATNIITLENQKAGSLKWQHKDLHTAIHTEQEAEGLIPKTLPETHDVATYCSATAANFPWAADDCISGYSDAPSVNIGQSINFKVSVNPAPQTYSIEFFRLGWYDGAGSTSVQTVAAMPGVKQPDCPMTNSTGETECNWSNTYTLNVPSTWTSGVYTAVFTSQAGWKTEVLFVVRDDSRVADFLYSVPVLTYAAYNTYPSWSTTTSKTLYDASSAGALTVAGTTRAVRTSLNKPLHHQFGGWLGSDWMEIHLVAWLEKMGYNVAYTTDVDIDGMNKTNLLNYKGILFGGHSEYWTRNMFENAEYARDSGVNLAFFGANAAHWQVRLEKDSKGKIGRSEVCYKDTLTSNIDPILNTALKTKHWRDLGKPEQTLVGVQNPFDGWYLPNTNQPPLIVQNSSSWVYDNTSVVDGTAIPHLVGYEIDILDPAYPGPTLKTPTSQTILAASPFVNTVGTSYLQQSSLYVAPSGAMVFGSGTMAWSWGLGRLETATESFISTDIQLATKNILDAFAASNNVQPAPVVTAFEHVNYQGATQQFGIGQYRAISAQLDTVGNDRLSSLKVPAGYGVKICYNEPEFGTGLCQNYTSSTTYVGLFMNDQTSYIEVYKLPATSAPNNLPILTVFKDAYYAGTRQQFGLGAYRANLGQLNTVGNDTISSLFIPTGYAVKACEKEPELGYGRCAVYNNSTNWVGLQMNDIYSYLEFYKQ